MEYMKIFSLGSSVAGVLLLYVFSISYMHFLIVIHYICTIYARKSYRNEHRFIDKTISSAEC